MSPRVVHLLLISLLVLAGLIPARSAQASCRFYRDRDGDLVGVFSDNQLFVNHTCTDVIPGWAGSPGDCNDNDPNIAPGRPELCDGIDNDCDNTVDDGHPRYWYYVDGDGDNRGRNEGATARYQCSRPSGYAMGSGDCNDANATIYPGAPELCDARDNDCDSVIDEGLNRQSWYPDADGDLHGDPAGAPVLACTGPPGYAPSADDCDDTHPARYVHAFDPCDDIDNDCDGELDEDASEYWSYADRDGDGHGDPETSLYACSHPNGYVLSGADCDDDSATIRPGGTEVCNGADDDCNGSIDDGTRMVYGDADGDGFIGQQLLPAALCAPVGQPGPDCDDTHPHIHPGAAPGVGVDADCDGALDALPKLRLSPPDCATPWVFNDRTEWVCEQGYWTQVETVTWGCGLRLYRDHVDNPITTSRRSWTDRPCDLQPAGPLITPTQAPCDSFRLMPADDLPWAGPSSIDCVNGTWHETWSLPYMCDDSSVFYQRLDIDSGQACTPEDICESSLVEQTLMLECLRSGGMHVSRWTAECEDGSTQAGRREVPTGEACDVPASWESLWPDDDEDGWGRTEDGASFDVTFGVPVGYTWQPGDCDDLDPTISPGMPDPCDGLDQDCDGLADDGQPDQDGDGACDGFDPCPSSPTDDSDADGLCDGQELCAGSGESPGEWFPDADGDGHGDILASPVLSCAAPPGHVTRSLDCDDDAPHIHPGATDACLDGVDQDCDGRADHQPYLLYRDHDGDSFGSVANPTRLFDACAPESTLGWGPAGDCDDQRFDVAPHRPEWCDGRDNDCDGASDEGEQAWVDADGDGWGDDASTPVWVPGCDEPPPGYAQAGDCDDADDRIHPGAYEACGDGVDNDCSGTADERLDLLYPDRDGDGFGDTASGPTPVQMCASSGSLPPGLAYGTDCDDTRPEISPIASELCDGVDNDCDGQADEERPAFRDADGDGVGAIGADLILVPACATPPAGFGWPQDCQDADPGVHPGAAEQCNGVDDDCDSHIDEAPTGGPDPCAQVCEPGAPDDADGDGVCDDVDLCEGDDATGDHDEDGVCLDEDFVLALTTLRPGTSASATVQRAPARARVRLYTSTTPTSQGDCLPATALCLSLSGAREVASGTTNQQGTVKLSFTVPATLRPGRRLYFQAVWLDPVTAQGDLTQVVREVVR